MSDSGPSVANPSVSSPSVSSHPLQEHSSEPSLEPETPVAKDAMVVSSDESEKASDESDTDSPLDTEQGSPFVDGLSDGVAEAVLKSGYQSPTEVQKRIIPRMLEGRDVLAQSQTGTGKTAAFALPILTRIEKELQTGRSPADGRPAVLVLAPTRELAIQVSKSFSTYASCLPGFGVATIYGGQDYEPQLKQLRRRPQVVVGTPGRVIDHVQRGTLDLSGVQCLVLDEGDEMLNMGFLEDIQFVLDAVPNERQIAIFSATFPDPIKKIAQQYLSDPVKITVKSKTMTADAIRQRVVFAVARNRLDVLKRFLEVEPTDGVIIFTKTKDATVVIAEKLAREGHAAVALNGDMPQRTRERTVDSFRKGRLDILVATDVAARGLDVTRVSHVFNYDLPHDSQSYIHRIGRTGRAGRSGEALLFLSPSQRGKLRMIERATKQKIEVVSPPPVDEINAHRIARFCERIDDTVASQDLTLYKALIEDYAKASGKPVDLIAAALAHAAQNGKPLMVEEIAEPARRDRREKFDDDFERGQRSNGKSEDRRPRRVGPPKLGKVRYRLEVGRRDGVRPGNIVGAVANEAGLDGEFIGPISIHDDFSTVDLPEGMPNDIFQSLRNTRVAGKKLQLSVDRGRRRDSNDGSGADRQDRPPRKKRHGGKRFGSGGGFPKGKRHSGGKKKAKSKR